MLREDRFTPFKIMPLGRGKVELASCFSPVTARRLREEMAVAAQAWGTQQCLCDGFCIGRPIALRRMLHFL